MAPKRKPRTCAHCGATHWNRQRKYCSDECHKAAGPWNKGKKGIPANRQRTGETRQCRQCGVEFYKKKHQEYAYYCSAKCYFEHRWQGHTETRTCVVCRTPFEIQLSDPRTTCSIECAQKWKRLSHLGERSHFWRGGKTAPYHSEWRIYRAAAVERDGHKCVLCGATDTIQVHHINPYRYSKSHELDNLVTLCRKCHSKEELKINSASRNGLSLRWIHKKEREEQS